MFSINWRRTWCMSFCLLCFLPLSYLRSGSSANGLDAPRLVTRRHGLCSPASGAGRSRIPPDELVHDRYFYLPSIGAALLVALLINPAGRQGALVFGQSLRLVVTALVLAACSELARSSDMYWSDDLTFYKHGHEIAPRNSVV